jgi:hypothetical protein
MMFFSNWCRRVVACYPNDLRRPHSVCERNNICDDNSSAADARCIHFAGYPSWVENGNLATTERNRIGESLSWSYFTSLGNSSLDLVDGGYLLVDRGSISGDDPYANAADGTYIVNDL